MCIRDSFGVAVNAVVSVVLFDQNLDQKIDLGWPGSNPGLAQVKPWAGPGQALSWARVKPLGKSPQFSQGLPRDLKKSTKMLKMASL